MVGGASGQNFCSTSAQPTRDVFAVTNFSVLFNPLYEYLPKFISLLAFCCPQLPKSFSSNLHVVPAPWRFLHLEFGHTQRSVLLTCLLTYLQSFYRNKGWIMQRWVSVNVCVFAISRTTKTVEKLHRQLRTTGTCLPQVIICPVFSVSCPLWRCYFKMRLRTMFKDHRIANSPIRDRFLPRITTSASWTGIQSFSLWNSL